MKEKAKKLKHSLSGRKKMQENDVHDDTPSWGVALDDDDEEDVDPEYLGAPSNIFLNITRLLFQRKHPDYEVHRIYFNICYYILHL